MTSSKPHLDLIIVVSSSKPLLYQNFTSSQPAHLILICSMQYLYLNLDYIKILPYSVFKACLHDARFVAQSLWTRPPMTFGTSCSILRARSCVCARLCLHVARRHSNEMPIYIVHVVEIICFYRHSQLLTNKLHCMSL